MKKSIVETEVGRVSLWQSEGTTGLPVLLCHSNSTSAAVFQAALTGAPGRERRLIALEFPGHGDAPDSNHPERDYSIPGLGRFVGAVIAKLGLERYVLCGHSLGGHVLSEKLPDLPGACGLFLISAPPIDQEALSWIFRPDPTEGCLFKAQLSDADVLRFANCLASERRISAEQRHALTQAIARTDGHFRSNLGASLARGEFKSEREIQRNATVPIALVSGAEDPFIDPECYDKFVIPRLWEGQVQVIEQAGHTPQLENPAAFEATFARFLGSLGQ